ncbi:hypothetical protein ACFL6D_04635 [Spirochaetota bacterium]
MKNNKISNLKIKGEAHIYAAIAKADGEVSGIEKARAPYLGGKAQKVFDIFKAKDRKADTIKNEIKSVLSDDVYAGWTALMHLDEGVALLNKAMKKGDYSVRITVNKHIEALKELALLGNYDIRESRFLQKVEEQLTGLRES